MHWIGALDNYVNPSMTNKDCQANQRRGMLLTKWLCGPDSHSQNKDKNITGTNNRNIFIWIIFCFNIF